MDQERSGREPAAGDAESSRRFPENTCPASRHTALIADTLDGHEAESLRSTCEALWKARDEIERLRAALMKISNQTQTRDLLWWQEEARRALGQEPDSDGVWPRADVLPIPDFLRRHR